MVTAEDLQAAAALVAGREPGQQVLADDRVEAARREGLFAHEAAILFPAATELRLRGYPGLLGDDAERLVTDPDRLAARAGGRLDLAPAVALPRLVPDDLAAIELTVERFADRRRRPPRRAPPLRRRRGAAGVIQPLGDALRPCPGGAERKHLANDVGFGVR